MPQRERLQAFTDRGRGIPPEVLARVFDRFESHTAGSRHRGVGLGLSIVRAFMELHGGKVLIDSVPGEGTTVTCVFPAVGAQDETRPAGFDGCLAQQIGGTQPFNRADRDDRGRFISEILYEPRRQRLSRWDETAMAAA